MRSLAAFQASSIPLHHIPILSIPPLSYPVTHRGRLGHRRTAGRTGATVLQNWNIENTDIELEDTATASTTSSSRGYISMPTENDLEQAPFIIEQELVDATSSTKPQTNHRKSKNKNKKNNPTGTALFPSEEDAALELLLEKDTVTQNPPKGTSWSSLLGHMPPTAILALNAVAILWGTQHAVVKLVLEDSTDAAGPFTLLRFGLGALLASALLLFQPKPTTTALEKPDPSGVEATSTSKDMTSLVAPSFTDTTMDKTDSQRVVWRWGTEMGFWMFLGFAFQAIGLATTTAQRSGFLLYLNVKFVPLFAFVLLGRRMSLPTILSALAAFSGTALLAYDGTSWSLNAGDLWSIAAAAASAMYILRLDAASKGVGDAQSVQLNAACLWVVTILSGVWSLGTTQDPSQLIRQVTDILVHHPWELFYLSAVTTALANWIQTKSQKDITAERASVIYAMDPVYGAVFSNLLLGETLTSLGLVGAGMITVAAATNALLDLGSSSGSSTTTTSGGNSGDGAVEQEESESDANKTKSQ